MAKKNNQYSISYLNLIKQLSKGPIPNNILLFTQEKILLDEITSLIANKFIGEKFSKNNIHTFYSDDKDAEGVLNECSNLSLFSERKSLS